MSDLHHHLLETGEPIWQALLACLFALSALAVERLVVLGRAAGPGVELRTMLERSLRAGDLHDALGIAAASSGTFARVALRVLRDGLRDPLHVEAAAVEALAIELPPLERRVAGFAFLASIATLIGLFGSITGITVGYGCVANADAASRAIAMARGVSESMNGLVIALLVAGLAFVARWLVRALIDRRTAIVRAETRALLNTLVATRTRLRLGEHRPVLEPRGYRRVDARF